MKIMEMHAQNVICGPQKKKIKKKLFLAKLFTKNQKSIPNLPQVTLLHDTYLPPPHPSWNDFDVLHIGSDQLLVGTYILHSIHPCVLV